MHDYILFMHDDAPASAGTDADWSKYIDELKKSGKFLGGKCYSQSGATKEIAAHITGYLRVQAASLDDARRFLEGNPVFESGGTVEIRELPQS